jgi:hypothetical protein
MARTTDQGNPGQQEGHYLDFIGIIRSLEELLYEVMSWLIFYPRTLWRTIRDPVAVTAYSDAEQNDRPSEQYTETLSPPLLLMITMVLTYALAHGLGSTEPKATTEIGKEVTNSAKNLLLLRALIFAIIPLVISGIAMKRNGVAIDRTTLRRPFYSQCFLVTPFALMLQIGIAVQKLPGWGNAGGIALAVIAFLWFGWAQTGWFSARLAVTRCAAVGWAIAAIIAAAAVGGGVTALIALSL